MLYRLLPAIDGMSKFYRLLQRSRQIVSRPAILHTRMPTAARIKEAALACSEEFIASNSHKRERNSLESPADSLTPAHRLYLKHHSTLGPQHAHLFTAVNTCTCLSLAQQRSPLEKALLVEKTTDPDVETHIH